MRSFKKLNYIYNYYMYNNPYYGPEDCGLTIIGMVEIPLCYEFDMFVVWKDNESGNLYCKSDSGCSCPTPFEDIHSLDDLIPILTIEDYDREVKGEHSQYPLSGVIKLRKKVEKELN